MGLYDDSTVYMDNAKIENVKYIKDSGNGDKFLSDNGKYYSIDNNMILSTRYMYDNEWTVTGNYERLLNTDGSGFFRTNSNTVKMIPNANNKPKILNTTRLTSQIKVNFLMKSQEYSYIVNTLGLDHAIFKIKLINAKTDEMVYSDTIYPEDFKAWVELEKKWVNIFDGKWHKMSALLYTSGLEGYENDLYLEFEPIITDTNYTIDISDIQVTPISIDEDTIQSGGNISEMLERTYRYADETITNTINDEVNQSNWTETDTTKFSYIKNKPNLSTVATSGNYNDLSNKPNYVVETVEEMNALVNVKEGDTCVVSKYEVKKLLNIGDNLKDKTIYFDNLNEFAGAVYWNENPMVAKNLDLVSEKLIIRIHTYNNSSMGVFYSDYDNDSRVELEGGTLSSYSNNLFTPDDCTLAVTKNFEVTSISDSNELYNHMYINKYEKHNFIYDNNVWVDTTIYPSLINGNIKKGNNEIAVFRPDRINSNPFNIDNTNRIVYVTIKTYDAEIPLKIYKENGYYKFYEVRLDDEVDNNISYDYNFKFCLEGTYYRNEDSDYMELKFNYNSIKIPLSWFSSSTNVFYINRRSGYNYNALKYISNDEYTNIPIGLKRLQVDCTGSSLDIYLNNNNYVSQSLSYGNGVALIVYKSDLHSIQKYYYNTLNNLSIPNFTDGLYILYCNNNSSTLSDSLKTWLDSLGCTKYKTVTTLKNYLMISYGGNTIEYLDSNYRLVKTISCILDKETKTLMPVQFIDSDSTSLSTGTITLDNKLTTPRINVVNSSSVYEGALWNSTYNRTVHDGLHLTHEPSKYLILGYKDETDGIYYSYMIMDEYRVLDDGGVDWCPIRFEKEALFRQGLKIGAFSDIKIGGYNLTEKISSLESAITTGTGMVQWSNEIGRAHV